MRARTLALLVALTGCDAPPASPDAALQPDGGTVVAAPEAPRLTPCPEGWSEIDREGVAVCSPGAAIACTGARFQLPGAAECEPIDTCGTGPFPDVPGDRAALYVAEGASGDGTLASPFGSIVDALAVAASGTIVAIGAGTYEGSLDLPDGVELHGVCADRVTIRGPTGAPVVALRAGRTATLSSVTIGGDDVGIFAVGQATLRGVAVIGAQAGGIAAIGAAASIDGERVLVRDTRTDPSGRLGRGVEIHLGAVRLASSVIEGSHDNGIASTGGSLELTDVAVRDTQPNGAERFGAAIATFEGTVVTISRVVVDGAREAGVLLDGVEATVRDLVVRDVASEPSMANGNGVFVRAARVTLERAWIDRASRAGIALYRGSELIASDVVIEGTRASGPHGVGLGIASSTASVTRIAIRDVRYAGALAVGDETAPASGTITDLTIDRVAIEADIGEGVLVGNAADLDIEQFAIRAPSVIGAQVFGDGAHLALRSGSISDVSEGATFAFGRGVEVDVGARLELADVSISGVRESGIVAYDASATIERTRVTDIGERSCATSTCAGEGGGSGVVAVFRAAVSAVGLEVDGAPLCGVQVAHDASLDVESGEIRASAIGACVQVPGYDVARLVDGVAYRDNETNVDTGGVFVPPPGPTDPPAF